MGVFNLPDFPELITAPVSSQADDDVDDLLSSSTGLLNIDSFDVHGLDVEIFLLLLSFNECAKWQAPFVMETSSKSSSIFNTGKSPLLLIGGDGKLRCLWYALSMFSVLFVSNVDESKLNDCNGM